MAVYAIAQLTIHDRTAYDRYASRFAAVLRQHGGRLLAADEQPEVLEGEWRHHKVVVIELPDEASLRAWATSDAYVEISKDRVASTTGSVLLVHGL